MYPVSILIKPIKALVGIQNEYKVIIIIYIIIH